MGKASFLNNSKPLLCAMIQEKTPELAIQKILNCRYDGAEAFGIQLECLEREYRTEEHLKSIFESCGGMPIYVTSYRNYESTGYTDDDCMEYLYLAAKCGATLCDVMGDTFDFQTDGTTYDEKAVEKQKKVIEKLHGLGVEVLMSTHTTKFFNEEEIYKIAKAQNDRNVDVIKIVNISNSEDELMANINICANLKKVVDKKYLYLASGSDCRLLRQIGGRLGCVMHLCVNNYETVYSKDQPILRSQKLIRDNLVK